MYEAASLLCCSPSWHAQGCSVVCINRAGHGCAPFQVMDVPHIKLWMCRISGHGCTPCQSMDVPHIKLWMYPVSSYGCSPYHSMDVVHIKSWIYPMSGHGCIPFQVVNVPNIRSWICPMSVYGFAPYPVPESSLTQDTPPPAFPTPCSPPPLASCIMLLIYRSCLVQPLTHKTITCVLLVV